MEKVGNFANSSREAVCPETIKNLLGREVNFKLQIFAWSLEQNNDAIGVYVNQ